MRRRQHNDPCQRASRWGRKKRRSGLEVSGGCGANVDCEMIVKSERVGWDDEKEGTLLLPS